MIRLRRLVGVIGFMAMSAGAASAYDEAPVKSVEKANGPVDGVDRHVATPIVPYSHACQTREYAPNCFGRFANWLTYQPDCCHTPCEPKYTSCYPPLFTYFSTSPFNRCYKKYDCCECEKPGWFRGWFCGRFGHRCKPCETEKVCAAPCRTGGSWSLNITFPSISISRGCEVCDACPAPVCEKACPVPIRERACVTPKCKTTCDTCPTAKDRCMLLPRPISATACENSSAGCPAKSEGACCDAPCRPRIFNGRILGYFGSGCGLGGCGLGGCGACGYGKQCCNAPVHSPVDLDHMPILNPQDVKGSKPGSLNSATTTAEPTLAPPPATTPVAPVEVLPPPTK